MDSIASDPLVGRRVGQYDIVAKLGGGGMGVVYAAIDRRLGRRVALKFLPPQWSHDETAKQRFIREAQAASATDHRHICTIHDIGATDDGQLFIVMAHYDGETLKQRLESGALPIDDVVEIGAEIAEGLAKAHGQGVVHRDIKPGNLMLTEDGVKILDFGLAKFADALQLTVDGSTIGTVAYMSPEQARAEEADARSDIWSVGVVMYEMLAGAPPFKAAYAEAIAHAIRTDPPPPIARADGVAIPEPLWRIVCRCLEKDANTRYQHARELARDLRLLQGRTLPLDLLTQPVRVPASAALAAPRRRLTMPRAIGAVAVAAALVGTPVWLLAPVDRVPIAVVPVINQSGYAELDAYRLALTEELIAGLTSSPAVRVMPYSRLMEIIQRVRSTGGDISGPDALQAIAAESGARVLAIPTLVYEGGAWKAHLEFRDAETRTSAAAMAETPPLASSLPKDTAYRLIATLVDTGDERALTLVPRRASLAASLRHRLGLGPPASEPRFHTLDASAAFTAGLDAYDAQEYASAAASFAAASAADARSPLTLAWRSRVARLMRHDDEAVQLADQAAMRVDADTPARDRLFVGAVVAEVHQRTAEAESKYRELTTRRRDDAGAEMELAGFLDRQGQTEPAIAAYTEALQREPRLVRAELELCRMDNRATEFVKAQDHATRAIRGYRRLGARPGEAQALLCRVDALRTGTMAQRQQAKADADAALAIFRDLRLAYNLPRAYSYLAMIAGIQQNMAEAAAYGEQALAAARDGGNLAVQPLVLMNLGAAYARVDRPRAVDNYEQSYRLYEAFGDQARAAEVEANRGALLIAFGANPDDGLRNAQNALVVSRKLGNRYFEAYCLQLTALYAQRAGRHAEAERVFNQAAAIARQRGLGDTLAAVLVNHARSKLAISDYAGARDLLTGVLAGRADPGTRAEASIQLARAYLRLGDFPTARASLDGVDRDAVNAAGLDALRLLARGELDYEEGRVADARADFAGAAAASAGEWPDPASIEAAAYVGLIDGLSSRFTAGQETIEAALRQARARFALEALCRLFLARIETARGHVDAALRTLSDIPPDDDGRTIGPELRAQVHYWRAQALHARDDAAAQSERGVARTTLEPVLNATPPEYRRSIVRRADIARIVG